MVFRILFQVSIKCFLGGKAFEGALPKKFKVLFQNKVLNAKLIRVCIQRLRKLDGKSPLGHRDYLCLETFAEAFRITDEYTHRQ